MSTVDALAAEGARPAWQVARLERALVPFGLTGDEVMLLAAICVPQHNALGLRPALDGLATIVDDDLMVVRWCQAVALWAERTPRALPD